MNHSPANQPPKDQRHKENSYSSQSSLLLPKKMNMAWYVRLNIMVISFLFVLLMIKQVQKPAFQKGLSHIFANPPASPAPPSDNNRSAKIQLPEKAKS